MCSIMGNNMLLAACFSMQRVGEVVDVFRGAGEMHELAHALERGVPRMRSLR